MGPLDKTIELAGELGAPVSVQLSEPGRAQMYRDVANNLAVPAYQAAFVLQRTPRSTDDPFIEVILYDDVPDNLLAWSILHELGHAEQYMALGEQAWKQVASHVRFYNNALPGRQAMEADAWNVAYALSRLVDLRITPWLRKCQIGFLSTYNTTMEEWRL